MRKDKADNSNPPYDRSNDPDSALVAQAQSGQASAISQLMLRYQKRVFGVCYRMVSDYEDAADLTQECLIRVFTHLDHFEGRSAFSTWVIRIAMNVSLSHLRKRRRSRETVSPADINGLNRAAGGQRGSGAAIAGKISDHREHGEWSSVEQNEESRLLADCLDKVGDEYRALLILRDIQGLEYAHMAEVLGIPIGTVKSRLFRARLAFRKAYERRNRNSTTVSGNARNHTDITGQAIEVPGG